MGLGALGGVTLVGALLAGVLAASAYAGIWALPRNVGMEASPLYRGLLWGCVGSGGLAAVGVLVALLFSVSGLGAAAAGFILR